MTILFLSKEYKHEKLPNSGGTGSFISNISKSLVKKGHIVHVFCLSKFNTEIDDFGVQIKFQKNQLAKNPLYKLLKSISKRIHFLSSFNIYLQKLELWETNNQLNKYIKNKKLKIDIVEAHDFDGISLYLDNKIPYVVRCHGSFSIFQEIFGFHVQQHKLKWEKQAMKKAKNIITISKYSQKLNHEVFGILKSRMIYNGLDSEKFVVNELIKIIPKSIFYFGNLSLEKGADTAIEILLKVVKTNPSACLHFIGIETDYKINILNIIKIHKIVDNVIFHGFQNTEQIINLLSSAQVILFPSKGETFGLGLCESMLLSKPIIVSNIPSFNEIISHEKNGFIANSIDEYCHYINYIFENPKDLKKIEFNARKTIFDKFNLDKMVEETLEYYTEVIKLS